MSKVENGIIQHLTDDGTTSGSNNLAVDGSVTPVPFWYELPAGRSNCTVKRLLFLIRDNAALAAEKFGGLPELTNGLELGFYDADDALILDCFGGVPQKSNADLDGIMYDVEPDTYGSGDHFIHARLSFDKFLDGGAAFGIGTKLKATVSDDLTGLMQFRIVVEGEFVT